MPKRYPKLEYHIVCDDIRQEVGNKISLIGIYPGNDMSITIPSVIPKLCFHLAFSYLKPGDNLGIQLFGPDNKKIMSIDNIKLPEKPGLSVLQTGFMGIKVNKEGTYRLVIVFGEEEKAKQEIKIEIKKRE